VTRITESVNEFYKKGCQEKSSASTGGEILSRDPAHSSFVSLKQWLVFHSRTVPCGWGKAIEFAKAASGDWFFGQPWFYPRLVAYRYFWLSEGA
jgi:hypothetical protein